MKVALPKIDALASQKLTYSQFVASNLGAEGLAKDEIIGVVFKLLDIDRDGTISQQDLLEFLKGEHKGLTESPYGTELLAEIQAQQGLSLATLSTMIKAAK